MTQEPRNVVDDYLTRTARNAWPSSSVRVRFESDDVKTYLLEIPGETPFVLGTAFGPARASLRAIVFEHLPPEANRSQFTFESRVIDDARRPSAEDLNRAARIGAALRDESSSRADAVLAGKLLELASPGSFTLEDVRALRSHGAKGRPDRADYEQIADAIGYWCDLGDSKLRSY